jgi:uncharacterized repeat protein (TIGR03803 family)
MRSRVLELPLALALLVLVCWARGATSDAQEVDGAGPAGQLLQLRHDDSSVFYGTTSHGGQWNLGTVFRVSPRGDELVLHSFVGGRDDGANPIGALTRGRDGALYGTTTAGGTHACPRADTDAAAAGCGTVFKITPEGKETLLHSFTGLIEPTGELLAASDGSFYGIGPDQVFRIGPDGTETVLHSFQGGRRDGINPSSLIEGRDGNFYGTTQGGGGFNHGTVFTVTSSGDESLIYSFRGGADGEFPSAALIEGADGNFYGTTVYGGLSANSATFCDRGCGTVFRVTPQGVESVLHAFRGGVRDGAHPATALVHARDGNFYGTTSGGGSDVDIGGGTVFRISPSGSEATLYAFRDMAANGVFPSSLIEGADGNLYGTAGGGQAGQGVVFTVTLEGLANVLHSFGQSRRAP